MSLRDGNILYNIKTQLASFIDCCRNHPVKAFVIVTITFVIISKIFLVGEGFYAISDEFRYRYSAMVMYELSHLNFKEAINYIFSTNARPVEVVFKIIPTVVQFASAAIFKLNLYESANSSPLFVFNFIIYCLVLYIHYKFSKYVLKNDFLSLISVLLYGTLTNSYLYLRHALPYDASLLILYALLYKTIRYSENENLSFKKSFFLGFLAFLGYLAYPGYFPLFLVVFSMMFLNNVSRKNLIKKAYHSFCFFTGSVFCLLIFEFISRLGDYSYIEDALKITDAIKMGSFEESFSFIIKYLIEVDGVNGILVIVSMALFYLLLFYNMKNKAAKEHLQIILLGLMFTGVFLFYASSGYFLHKMVFYGRLLHQYFPFICIFSVYTIDRLLIKSRWRNPVFFFFSLILLVNYCVIFNNYKSIAYPRDIAWQLKKTHDLAKISNIAEYDNIFKIVVPDWRPLFMDQLEKKDTAFNDVIVTNCCLYYFFDDLTQYHKFDPGNNYTLTDVKPYFFNFKAYQYEGAKISERDVIDKINLQIRVFSKGGREKIDL